MTGPKERPLANGRDTDSGDEWLWTGDGWQPLGEGRRPFGIDEAAPSIGLATPDLGRHLDDVRTQLRQLEGGTPLLSSVVWPAGLSRRLLADLPLRNRTRNCLHASELLQGSGSLTVAELLRTPNFGRLSLRDLLTEVERFLSARIRDGDGEASARSWRQRPMVDTDVSLLPEPAGLPGHSAKATQPSPPGIDEAAPSIGLATPDLGRHLDDVRTQLRQLEGGTPLLSSVVWPAGLSRRLLADLPLRNRTRNCLYASDLMQGSGPLTVRELLRTPNFGRRSLWDLLTEVERFLSARIRDGDVLPEPTGLPGDGAKATRPSPPGSAAEGRPGLPEAWVDAVRTLGPLFAAALELKGVATLGDALSKEVADLAGEMEMASDLAAIPVRALAAGCRGPVSVALERLEGVLEALSGTARTIVERRLVRNPQYARMTLAEVGSLVGLTRERVRQLQKDLEGRLERAAGSQARLVSAILRKEFAPLVDAQTFDQRVDAVLGTGGTLAGQCLRTAVVAQMGYERQRGACMDSQAAVALADLKNRAKDLADDAGLTEKSALLAPFPDHDWRRRHWPAVRRCVGLHEIKGSLAIRDTVKARAKAALISLGRPATPKEIASASGLDARQTVGAFSNMASVVRESKDRWALDEWVDDEYDGIVGEIIQRIDEDGGTTTIERLLAELPARFNVSPQSVRAYMKTPRFEVRNGWITLASPTSIRLRDIDDAVDGRDEHGAPFWTFVVETRHFRGYSVVGVPPELAKALGCEPESGIDVHVENLPGCRALSLHWHLASLNGASFGYLAEPLKRLDVKPGERARVTMAAPRSVRLGPEPASTPGRAQGADAALDRMLKRRRAIQAG